MKNTRRKCVQGEFAVFVYDRVSRIRSALEADDDIRSVGHCIRDLSLAFISPVCAYNSFYHFFPPCCKQSAFSNILICAVLFRDCNHDLAFTNMYV